MAHESAKEDALLRAISELRALADQLIDEQIARINALPDDAGELALGSALAGASPAVAAAAPAAPRATTAAQAKVSARLTSASPRPQAPSRVAAVAKPNGEPVAPAAARADAVPPTANEAPRRTTFALTEDDSKLRLDALAKHLDDRMRRSRDAAAEKQKTGTGR